MKKNDYSAYTFPDMELYAGDTTEWVVPIHHEILGGLSEINTELLSAVLTILPHNISVITASSPSAETVSFLSIEGVLDDNGAFHFAFSKNDTLEFRGKYKYQIDIHYENDLRICQGNLYFRRNINQ